MMNEKYSSSSLHTHPIFFLRFIHILFGVFSGAAAAAIQVRGSSENGVKRVGERRRRSVHGIERVYILLQRGRMHVQLGQNVAQRLVMRQLVRRRHALARVKKINNISRGEEEEEEEVTFIM